MPSLVNETQTYLDGRRGVTAPIKYRHKYDNPASRRYDPTQPQRVNAKVMRSPTNGRAAASVICVLAPSFGSLVCGFPLTDMKGLRLTKTEREHAY